MDNNYSLTNSNVDLAKSHTRKHMDKELRPTENYIYNNVSMR